MEIEEEVEYNVTCKNCGKEHTLVANKEDNGSYVHHVCDSCGHVMFYRVWIEGNAIIGYSTNINNKKL